MNDQDIAAIVRSIIVDRGSTGRAGQTGDAMSLVSAEDRGLLPAIQRLLPSPIQEVRAPAQIWRQHRIKERRTWRVSTGPSSGS